MDEKAGGCKQLTALGGVFLTCQADTETRSALGQGGEPCGLIEALRRMIYELVAKRLCKLALLCELHQIPEVPI